MIIRTALALCMTVVCGVAQQKCLSVDGDQILASDLGRALPAFRSVSPATPIAPAPLPGGTRTFSPAELQSLGVRFSIRVGVTPDVCFQLSTEPLSPERVLSSMRDALQIPGVNIQLVELSSSAVPHGRIEFPRDRLGTPASFDQNTPTLWRGDVVYAASRRFAVWARVRVTSPVARVVAIQSLKPGAAVAAGDLRVEMTDSFPPIKAPPTIEQMVGMVVRRPVAAGAAIGPDDLIRPADVSRGDVIRIDVTFGAAHLAFNARAESGGSIGDIIAIRNPESKRLFSARIQGRDAAVVEPNTIGLIK